MVAQLHVDAHTAGDLADNAMFESIPHMEAYFMDIDQAGAAEEACATRAGAGCRKPID